jgi:hypothetical protein
MKYYLISLLLFQPIEEIHNCNHPNTLGEAVHLICVWTDHDFVNMNDGTRVLRPKRKMDNFIKAYYRRKYWDIRNAPSRK